MIRVLLFALFALVLIPVSAQARHYYRHHHRHYRHQVHNRHVRHTHYAHDSQRQEVSTRGGLTHERLDSGQTIVVAARFASRFTGFLNALYHQYGRLPAIGCYSPTGHMRNSLHHWGGACDVGQSARNRAWAPMYHVAALAARFGLTDGCSWRHPDCGHVDVSGTGGHRSGLIVARNTRHRRGIYAEERRPNWDDSGQGHDGYDYSVVHDY